MLLLALAAFWGCAAGARKMDATSVGYAEDSKSRPAPAPSTTRREQRRAMLEAASGVSDGGGETTSEDADESGSGEGKDEAAPVARMIVYRGQMDVRTVSPVEAARQAGFIAGKLGGHVEKSDFYESGRRVVVILRVPAARFFEALDQLSTLGTILSRSLSAEDVTQEFTDVEARLRSARLLKERLERLLESVKNVDEKVKILREISRLGAEIETLTARSKYLADRSSMSTITLQLSGEALAEDRPDRRSPFAWVRGLDPNRRSLSELSSVEAARPPVFFDNSKQFRSGAAGLYFSPSGTVLRSGSVRNRPTGDAAFWRQALNAEFKGRLYKEVKNVALKDGQLWIFQIHDGLNLYYFGVSFAMSSKRLQVFEASSSSEAAFKQDAGHIESFLRSVEGGAK